MSPGEFRLRICYAKRGRLRYLSHLEVVRSLERAVRRAGLPYAVTKGFNPHMKAAFGPALPVGTASEREYLDVWLTRYTEGAQVLASLVASSPADLAPLEVRYVNDAEPSLTAALTVGVYEVRLEGEGVGPEEVEDAIARVVGEGTFSVVHKGKTKVFDLARSLPKEPRVSVAEAATMVEMAVRMGPEGSLRPDVFVREVLARAGIEPSSLGTTRLDVFIETDGGVWSRPV